MIAPGPNNPYARTARGLTYIWIAALVLALYPYTEDPASPLKYLVSAIAALLVSTIWAVGVAAGKTSFHRPHAALLALFAFFATQVATAACSESPLRSFDALQPWFGAALIALVTSQVFTETRHLRNLFRVVVFSVAVSSLYGFVQYAGLDPFPWSDRAVEEYRGLPSSYGNPNLAGHAMVIALVLCGGLMIDAWKRGKRKLDLPANVCAAMLMLGHLYLTGMRGGILALALAGVFATLYGLLAHRGVRPARAGAVALAIIGLLLAGAFATTVLLAPQLALDSSLQLRLNSYAGAAALFRDHLFLGIGPGNYAAHNIAYWTNFEALWYALENKRNFNVHNEWLEIAATSGLPGLAAFTTLFVVAVMDPLRAQDQVRGGSRALALSIPAVLVAMVIDACTGFNLHVPVSGTLFFVLAVQHVGAPAFDPALRDYRRALPLMLVLLALFHVGATWRTFQAARLYQQAQGALTWAREQRTRGLSEQAAQGEDVARLSLAAAMARTPYDYKIPMSAGDLELEQAQYADAIAHYETALAASPHLPRLHTQLARALIRQADNLAGDARGNALDSAAAHAETARLRCPDLADAWAMQGWAAYYRANRLDVPATDEYLASAVEAFQTARRLGLANDTPLNAALADVYGRVGAWPEASETLEICALAEPAQSQFWEQLAQAADHAGGPWPVRYRQALLCSLNGALAGDSATLAEYLASRLVGTPTSSAAAPVVRGALNDALRRYLDHLALWGAWLGAVAATEQAATVSDLVATLQKNQESNVPQAILALVTALQTPNAATMNQASEALMNALATAPGGERGKPVARANLPLLEILEQTCASTHLLESLQATTSARLGAAYFEAGSWEKADALLRTAENRLPARDRATAQYYRSRALLALGRPDAALSLAQQAAKSNEAPLEFQWQLARCMAAAGNVDAAAFLYESLIGTLPPTHPYGPLLANALAALRKSSPEATP